MKTSENAKENSPKLTNEERLAVVLNASARTLAERIREDVPESGPFGAQSCTFPIYGTQNEGYAAVEPWLTKGPELRGIRLGALREGTDMLVSYYLKTGTNEELNEYLSAPETQVEWKTRIRELSNSVDDKW